MSEQTNKSDNIVPRFFAKPHGRWRSKALWSMEGLCEKMDSVALKPGKRGPYKKRPLSEWRGGSLVRKTKSDSSCR